MGLTPFFHDDHLTVYQGDCREVMAAMEPESVHCVISSPPYWGLRDYGTATWVGGDEGCDHLFSRANDRLMVGSDGKLGRNNTSWTTRDATARGGDCPKGCGAVRQDSQLGLEPTPEAFVANMVDVFREVKRVLRKDGTLWLNLGDSYAGSGPNTNADFNERNGHASGQRKQEIAKSSVRGYVGGGLKPKDLVGIPWRVAFALQADGWYLRSDIIWAKPNPMPESVTDRPTKAHEYLFLLTKSARYYYDADAVREAGAEPDRVRSNEAFGGANGASVRHGPQSVVNGTIANRNLRSVWTIATAPYPGAHFATFPPKLVEPCVKAGTSERGVCGECGAPWTREVDIGPEYLARLVQRVRPEPLGQWLREHRVAAGISAKDLCAAIGAHGTVNHGGAVSNWENDQNIPTAEQWRAMKRVLAFGDEKDAVVGAWHEYERGMWGTTPNALTHGAPSAAPAMAKTVTTTGWRPSCAHDAEPVAAVVLDPFAGSGTTGMVAQALGRRAVLIDLNGEYLVQAMARNAQTPLGLVG